MPIRITLPVAWSGGTLLFGNGSAAAPSIAFASDTDTGFYRLAADRIGIATGGVLRADFGSTGLTLASGMSIDMSSGTTGVYLGGGGSIVGASGALTLAASGTAQSITLTPSTTGSIVLGIAQNARIMLGGASVTSTAHILKANGSNNGLRLWGSDADAGIYVTRLGVVLVGTETNSSNGIIQLATHTTSAGGIGFGTETSLFRIAAGNLALDHATNPKLSFTEAGSEKAFIQTLSGNFLMSCSTGSMTIRNSNNNNSIIFVTTTSGGAATTALTLDGSQNATFAGEVKSTRAGGPHFYGTRATNTADCRATFEITGGAAAGNLQLGFVGTSGVLGTGGAGGFIGTGTNAVLYFSTNNTLAATIDTSQRLVLAGALRLSNAYTAGAPAATGYVTVQDSAGNTMKLLCSNV